MALPDSSVHGVAIRRPNSCSGQVLAVRERMLGDAHPDTLATRNEVAWMLGKQGRYQEAEEYYRKVPGRAGAGAG